MSTRVEDGPLTSPSEEQASSPRLMHRLRLVATSVVLAALAFIQDPGRIAADTKLDLAVDPGGFLVRALSLWEPLGFFGQLQNQAYGYLFPVGPIFVLGDLVGLPAWVVQRLWWSALLIGAFLGVVRLARLLGVERDSARIIAGLAYALAPRMVTEIGVLSVEVLPFAVAPWVLIPLVSVAGGRLTPRRGAALSGVAVLVAGGVNAVATAAVLPLGAWWILTRFRGRIRVVLLGWWAAAVALATLWWAVPLLLLGRYSPPFLDWIESSSVTTLITSPDTVLRGATQWVAYVVEPGGPTWPGGWALVTTPVLILAAGIVAAVGLAGLALKSTPYRAFLVGGLLIGVVLVSMGHTGAVHGIAASSLQDALDGVLAPLRNTHKFDLILRLPLALGVGFALDALMRRATRRHPFGPRVVAGAMTMVVVLGAWPMATGALARDRSFGAIPDYWAEAAQWLGEESPDGRALVVPGASFGIYTWGRTQDEPLQALATSPWAVRDAVPLSSAGNIRWLDAVQERLDSGRGSRRLADALARAGVEYLVVRNDIDRRRSDTPRSVLIRQALVRSGGFTPVAGFGPALPPYRTPTTVVDDGLLDTVAAVEVWRIDSPVAPPDPRVTLRDASRITVASGSAESVVDLADADVLGREPVVAQGDEAPLEAVGGIGLAYAVTDGFRRSEVSVGSSRDNRSQTLREDESYIQDRRVHDYFPVDPEGRQSIAVYEGGTVTASSSGSEVTALSARASAAQPWAAFDDDPVTAWVSGELESGVGQWWEVTADEPFSTSSVVVRLVVGEVAGTEPASVTVTTDTGEVTVPVATTVQPQRLPVPPGATRALRLTLASVVDGGRGGSFGLHEVQIPGLEVSRRVRTPGVADGGPIVLTARKGEQAGCAAVAGELVCTPQLGRVGEERPGIQRIVHVTTPGDYRLRMWVRPRSGAALDRLLTPALPISPRAEASSVFTDDAAIRPQAVVDGVLSTSWVASSLDERPELTLKWAEPRRVRGVRMDIDPDLVASRPLRVTVTVNGRETTGIVSARGVLRFPPEYVSSVRLRFDNVSGVRSLDPISGDSRSLPVGVSEIAIIGAPALDKGPRLDDAVETPCGEGPKLSVNGVVERESAVSASVTDILIDAVLPVVPCGGSLVSLPAGSSVIDVMSTAEYAVEVVALEPVAAPVAITTEAPYVKYWGATHRTVEVPAANTPRILETTENANPGWSATLNGEQLEPVRVDGWRQGWIVPAGASGLVVLDFGPQSAYLGGLLAGLVAALALLALAFLGRRRPGEGLPEPPPGAGFVLAGSAAAVGLLLGGVPGLVAAAAAITLAWVTSRPLVAGVLGVVAAVGAAVMPWPGRLDAPTWLLVSTALLAIAALAAAAAPARTPRVTADEPRQGPASPG